MQQRPSFINLFTLLLAVTLLYSRATAQLVVTPNQTAQQLANKIAGDNVTILSPVLTCTGAHSGTFTTTSSNLGLGDGIILATASATQIANPYTVSPTTVALSAGDAQLSALINNTVTKDACILEFDFIPDIDSISTLHFQYVFGSEEYPGYTCSQYNDVFGFLLTQWGSSTPVNIALVPNTNIPVAINSINSGVPSGTNPLSTCQAMGAGSPFSQYFVNNAAANGQTVAFDGFTTVLTANAIVYPCDTYHMKMGVANAVDDALPSGVFLKANSFSVDTVTLNLNGILASDNGYLVEGCTPATITATRTQATSRQKKICLSYGGTATNGFDYSFLADTLIIPPYSTIGSMPLIPIQDNIPEPTETIIIRRLNCCTKVPIDSVILKIRDSLYIEMITPDTVVCQGDLIHPHVTGDTSFHYQWTATPFTLITNDTDTIASAHVPVQTVFTVEASFKSCPSVKKSFTADIEPYPIVRVLPEDTTVCLGDSMRIKLMVEPTTFTNYTYSWTPHGYLGDTTLAEPNFYSPVLDDYKYYVTVTTPQGCKGTDSAQIHTKEEIHFTLLNTDSTYCAGDTINLAISGSADYTYTWSSMPYNPIPNPIDSVTYAIADTTALFTVTATYSQCTPLSHSFNATVEPIPNVWVTPQDTIVCLVDSMILHTEVGPAWFTNYNYSWFPAANLSSPTVAEPKFYSQTLYDNHYTLTVQTPHGCAGSNSIVIRSKPPIYLDDITQDTTIRYGNSIQLNVTGADYYQWMPVSTLNNSIVDNPIATPLEPTLYTVIGMNVHGCRDTAEVRVNIDYSADEQLPTAFTPNGDGRNDRFNIFGLRFQKLLEFRVYDRWGRQVFETLDASSGWDGGYKGVPQDMGTYYYIIRVSRPDGSIKTYKGDITLVR